LSYDGYTSNTDLLKACIKKKINLIAITEHDKVNKIDLYEFKKNGIYVIYGCEYTSDCGAHIIGLFVNSPISNASAIEIVKHIKNEGGLVVIPHPYKPRSGLCYVYKDASDILALSDIIEVYNGGHYGGENEKKLIIDISIKYNIALIASSDAHKQNEIGYYVTRFDVKHINDLKSILLYGNREFYINSRIIKKQRAINELQKKELYQKIVMIVPYFVKRMIKIMCYFITKKKLNASEYYRLE